MKSKTIRINNKDFYLNKFGVVNDGIVIEVREKKTMEINYLVVSQFVLTNNEPIKENFFKRLFRKIFVR